MKAQPPKPRRGFLHRHRVRIASAAVLLMATASILVYALASRGNPSREAHLNDSGVWVSVNQTSSTAGTSAGMFGEINVPAQQFATTLIPRGPGASLDVLQDGNAVVGYDTQAASLIPIDAASQRLSTDTVKLGNAVAVMGGGEETGTLAVVDPDKGRLWALPVDPAQPLARVTDVDPASARPTALVGAGAVAVVGVTGTVYAVAPSVGLTTVTFDGAAWRSTVRRLAAGLGDALTVTAVGTQPVIMSVGAGSDTPALVLPNGKVIRLTHQAPGGVAVLQQPGPDAGDVLVATARALLSVSLSTGDVRTIAPGSGTPAAPVEFEQCEFAAWMGAPPTEARVCGTDRETKALTSSDGAAVTDLVFRRNHQELLLNDRASGQVWDDRTGRPIQIADWQAVQKPVQSSQQGSTDQTTGNDATLAPTARDDRLGARPGRVTVLHVLDNDTTPAGVVLTVNQVFGASSADATVTVAPDRQSVLVGLAAGASGTLTFQYDDANGGTKLSNKATVTVTVVPLGTYVPPNLRTGYTEPDWSVPVNGVLTIPVLNDWRDDGTGDPPALAALTPQSVQLSGASAIATSDGSIIYSAGNAPGIDTVSYVVVDGNKSTAAHLTVTVQARNARAVAPVAENDYVHLTVGQPLTVSPLGNDLPGSDPLTPTASLAIAGTIKGHSGLKVSVPDANGAVILTATAAGTYKLSYRDSYGSAPASAPGVIRVDATAPDPHAQVAAGPDAITVRGPAAPLLDPTADDASPSGGMLTVVGVHVDDGSNLQVAVVRGRWLRVNVREAPSTPTSETFSYSVTDGATTASAQVTVTELPGTANDQPVAVTDYATVRAGDSVTISPLDNDVDPGGDALSLVQFYNNAPTAGQLVVTGTGTARQQVGAAYVAGDQIRYDAPAADPAMTQQQQVRISYTARDRAGGTSDATAIVTIEPVGTVKTDRVPTPPPLEARVVAGGTVTIPVPTSGVDPDGDTVQVQGLALPVDGDPQPRLGALIGYTANSLTYQAYPSATNAGTDTFTYQVTDTYGLTARATVRVAVVQPTVLPPPVAHDATVSAAPGTTLALDVVSPGYVDYPDGAPPQLLDPRASVVDGPSYGSLDPKRVGWLDIAVPDSSPTGSITVPYQVQADLGAPSPATITVQIVPGYKSPPVAVDEFAKPKPQATSVVVDLLAGDYSPSGRSLSIKPQAGVAGAELTVALRDVPQVIPFAVTDDQGATATAVAYIPAIGGNSLPYWNGKTITIPAARDTTIGIGDYVTDPEGRALQLTDRQKVWASPTPGLAARITGTTSIVLTGATDFQGPASLTFAMTRTGDLNEYTVVTVPVIVGSPAPVLRCPTDVVDIEAGLVGGAKISPVSQCHVWTPPTVDPGTLRFHLAWQKDPGLVSFSRNDQLQDIVAASHDAKPGSTGVLAISIDGYSSVASQLNVRVVAAPLMTVAPILVQGVLSTGAPTVINLGSYVTSPFGFSAVSIVAVGSIPGAQVTVSSDRHAITIRATNRQLHGQYRLSYTVTDLSNTKDSSRYKSGNVTVQFIGVPDAPTAVTPRPGFLSEEVPVTWVAPANNGARIDQYEVDYTSTDAGGGKQLCASTTCTVTHLHNGSDYRFTVKAHNIAGWGSPSAVSGVGTPDVLPSQVTNFKAANPQDHSLDLTWTPVSGLASTVQFSYTIKWTGGASGSTVITDPTASSYTVTGLDNDTATQFTIFASNRAGAGPASMAGNQSAGKPAAPTFTNGGTFEPVQEAGGKYIVSISWNPVTDPNGPSPVTYTLYRDGTTVVCPASVNTSCDDTGFKEDGSTHSYDVVAANAVFSGPPSASASVEWTTPPDQMAAPTLSTVRPADPDGTVTVNFTTVPSNGKGLSVHCVYTSDGSAPTTSSATCPGSPWSYPPAGGTSVSRTLSGLNPANSSVVIRVATWEDNGSTQNTNYKDGPLSPASNAVDTNAPPAAPTASACGLNGDNVVYNWTAVTGTNGRSISYVLTGDINATVSTNSAQQAHAEDYQSHSITVTAKDSSGDTSTPPLSITCADHPPPPPPPVSNLGCGVNGTTITWTWNNPNPPAGVTYHLVLSDAISNSNYTGTSVSANFPAGSGGHNLRVQTVDSGGQAGGIANASCSSPPGQTVVVSNGALCGAKCAPSCTDPSCAYVNVTLTNFSGKVTCSMNSQTGNGGWFTFSAGNGTTQSPNWYGFPGKWVTANCGGVQSAQFIWP